MYQRDRWLKQVEKPGFKANGIKTFSKRNSVSVIEEMLYYITHSVGTREEF